MIRLRIEKRKSAPPPLRAGARGVVSWPDASGGVFALSSIVRDEHRIDIPRVGQFAFTRSEPEVVAWPGDGASDEVLVEHYYRAVLPLALQVRGIQVLHASAVELAGAVLALAGHKTNGKSTLAFGLSRRGYAPWADDAVVFEPDERGVDALALPFDLRLRREPAEYFGRACIVPVSRSLRRDEEPLKVERARLGAVVVLERHDGPHESPPHLLERLEGSAALLAVLAHAYCFEFASAEARRRIFDRYLMLVARVPIYRFRYRSGLEQVSTLVGRLASLFDEAVASPA